MHSHVRLQNSWIVLLDLMCLLASIFLAVVLRFGHDEIVVNVFQRLDGWVLFVVSILAGNYLAGSYRVQYTLSRFNLLVTWAFSVSVAMIILSITSYAWFRILLGRGVLGIAVVFYSAFSLYLRIVVFRAVFAAGKFIKRVVILGCGSAECRMRDYLENPFVLPQHRVVAWLHYRLPEDCRPAMAGQTEEGLPVVEVTKAELPAALKSLDVDMLVLGKAALPDLKQIYPVLHQIRFAGIEVMTPLAVNEIYCGRIPLDLLDEEEAMRTGLEVGLPTVFSMKRILDLSMVIVGSLFCLPLMVLIACAIKLSDPRGAVFYTQPRVGQFGKIFNIRKFRTMRANAESKSGAVWSSDGDERITGIGRFLRKFRLDELPQFWNVLSGEMSLVGPRPERPEIVSELEKQIPFFSEREYAPPGLSGWAQIHCPYGNTVAAARRKLEYDLFYIKNMSPSLDLQILLRTLRIVLFGKEKG